MSLFRRQKNQQEEKAYPSLTPQNSDDDFFSIIAKIKGNIIIQEGITQHPSLSRLNSSSINTLRLLTFISSTGEVEVLSGVVRIGREGSFVDNASSGGIVVGINSDGSLKNTAFNTKGEKFSSHPDNKIEFNTVTIPNYDKVKDTVKHLAWMLPQFRMLSWDIAIEDSSNIVLIEVNMASGQLDFHQLCNGPIFGSNTKQILSEVFNK